MRRRWRGLFRRAPLAPGTLGASSECVDFHSLLRLRAGWAWEAGSAHLAKLRVCDPNSAQVVGVHSCYEAAPRPPPEVSEAE